MSFDHPSSKLSVIHILENTNEDNVGWLSKRKPMLSHLSYIMQEYHIFVFALFHVKIHIDIEKRYLLQLYMKNYVNNILRPYQKNLNLVIQLLFVWRLQLPGYFFPSKRHNLWPPSFLCTKLFIVEHNDVMHQFHPLVLREENNVST